MLPDVSLGAAQTGFVQPKITQTASMTHGIKRSRDLVMVELADASTGDGSVKAGAIPRATITRRVLGEIPNGREDHPRSDNPSITSDNICHIKSNGVGADWV